MQCTARLYHAPPSHVYLHTHRFTTVSPNYAWEIGGHPSVGPNVHKMFGIRNGIDPDLWDPETDAFLAQGFTAGGWAARGWGTAREQGSGLYGPPAVRAGAHRAAPTG